MWHVIGQIFRLLGALFGARLPVHLTFQNRCPQVRHLGTRDAFLDVAEIEQLLYVGDRDGYSRRHRVDPGEGLQLLFCQFNRMRGQLVELVDPLAAVRIDPH